MIGIVNYVVFGVFIKSSFIILGGSTWQNYHLSVAIFPFFVSMSIRAFDTIFLQTISLSLYRDR